jgi:hypothetical protein
MKKLSERIRALEEMGIDTTQFNLTLSDVCVKPVALEVVEDKQVKNDEVFRRWIMAQTFRMLNARSYNIQTHETEYGWDAALRNRFPYAYQFKVLTDELDTLAKLEIKDKVAFKERANFFTKEVVMRTCNHYIEQFYHHIPDLFQNELLMLLFALTVDQLKHFLHSNQQKYIHQLQFGFL